MSILIKNAKVLLSENGKLNVKDSSILIEGSKITKIGDIEEKSEYEIIDGKNKLALPGLINTHCHSTMSLFRNYKDDVNLQDWLYNYIFPVENKLVKGECYWFSMLSILEMIRAGVTSFFDMYFFMDETARAVSESGVRANLSRSVSGTNDFKRETDYRLQESIDLFKNYNNTADGRIKISISPHSVYTCESEYLRDCGDIARELNADLQIHLCETQKEVNDCKAKTGMTPVEFCENLELFNQKGSIIAAHAVHLTDNDIKILKNRNITVSHNPTSNLKLASGVMDIEKAMEAGINIALGTDGAGSNNKLDILSEARLAALIHKGTKLNPTLLSAEDAIQMATINGAKAMSQNLGEIDIGKLADIILVDIDKPNYYPLNNRSLISAIIYSGNAADVSDVIANGKVLMKNKEILTIDEEKIKFEVGGIVKCLI